MQVARKFFIKGEVQGVGYRFFAQRAAARHQVVGYVRNCDDGSVEAFAEGPAGSVEAFKHDLATGPQWAVVDRDGNFNLRGTHRMQRGGPIRAEETPQDHPATYTGSIKGNTMTLNLKLSDSDVETFTLEKGKEGELFRCK